MPKRLLVTGSSGLIGAEVCRFFSREGFEIHGMDSHPGQAALGKTIPGFKAYEVDIRNRDAVVGLVREVKPYGIVHAAAQSSPERAATLPSEDFDTNAVGTLNMLEGLRRFAPAVPFIHLSTSQVYGDRPNTIELRETPTRWNFAHPGYGPGISEDFPIDHSTHTLLGASKVAADILVQEYGRYFHLPTCTLRLSGVTGPDRTGDEPHDFLAHLVKCNVERKEYSIFGHKGKQVQDVLHVEDVARFIHAFYEYPRTAEVYNLGGGPANACSIWEAFRLVEKYSGKPMRHVYLEKNRLGDLICYYSDVRRLQGHYPQWQITKSLEQIVSELVEVQTARQKLS